jgi:translation initiation factor 2-alpha kinase 4
MSWRLWLTPVFFVFFADCSFIKWTMLDEDIDALLTKLDKVSPSLTTLLRPIVEEVKETIQYATLTGVARPISFHPLMLGNHHSHFKDGVLVEVVRKNKRMDVLAAGGRYVALSSLIQYLLD